MVLVLVTQEGGFGIMRDNWNRPKEISEGFRHTTNNRMELLELLLD
jgi:ribonuclease HI